MKREIILFIVLMLSYIGNAQSDTTLRHHVIILIDRSAGMQQGATENTLNRVFDDLNNICFNKVEKSIGRPLLVPGLDYLSIVSFGLKSSQLNDYGFENDFLHTKTDGHTFGSKYDNTFSSDRIKLLKTDIFNKIGMYDFFNLQYAFPTTSITMAIDYLSQQIEDCKYIFDKTYIILVSDKERNDDGVGHELTHYENQINISNYEKIGDNIFSDFKKPKKLSNLCSEFQRTQIDFHYQGPKYYIETLALEPAVEGVSIESMINIEPTVFERYKYHYRGSINIEIIESKNFLPIKLKFSLLKNQKLFKNNEINLDTLNSKEFQTLAEIPNCHEDDTISLISQVTAIYNKQSYSCNRLVASEFSSLINEENIVLEPWDRLHLNILIQDWMMIKDKSQRESRNILNSILLILIIIFIIILLVGGILILQKTTYPLKSNQFEIKVKYNKDLIKNDHNRITN